MNAFYPSSEVRKPSPPASSPTFIPKTNLIQWNLIVIQILKQQIVFDFVFFYQIFTFTRINALNPVNLKKKNIIRRSLWTREMQVASGQPVRRNVICKPVLTFNRTAVRKHISSDSVGFEGGPKDLTPPLPIALS